MIPKINIISTNGHRWTVNKTSWSNPRQTRTCYIFQLWVIIKTLLKQISLYLLSHFRIRIIVLTCQDNKSARNHQPKSCVPAKSHKITMMRGQYYFNWNLRSLSVCSCSCEDSRVPPLKFYYDIFITEDLHCLKAVDGALFEMEGQHGRIRRFAVGPVYPNKSPTMCSSEIPLKTSPASINLNQPLSPARATNP